MESFAVILVAFGVCLVAYCLSPVALYFGQRSLMQKIKRTGYGKQIDWHEIEAKVASGQGTLVLLLQYSGTKEFMWSDSTSANCLTAWKRSTNRGSVRRFHRFSVS